MNISELVWRMEDAIPGQRTLRFRIGAGNVSFFCEYEASNLQPKVEAPGFRKGHAPTGLIMAHHWEQIRLAAFAKLKSAALKQVLEQLSEKDQPFNPPEVVAQDNVKLGYGSELEFAVRYLVDPAQLSHNLEQSEQQRKQGLSEAEPTAARALGVTLEPQLPAINLPSGAPWLPGFAAVSDPADTAAPGLESGSGQFKPRLLQHSLSSTERIEEK